MYKFCVLFKILVSIFSLQMNTFRQISLKLNRCYCLCFRFTIRSRDLFFSVCSVLLKFQICVSNWRSWAGDVVESSSHWEELFGGQQNDRPTLCYYDRPIWLCGGHRTWPCGLRSIWQFIHLPRIHYQVSTCW